MSLEPKFRGVWMPAHIWSNKSLSWGKKLLLVHIDSLGGDEGCYASNEYLAEFFGVSESRLADMLTELRKVGYIETVKTDGRRRWLKVNYSPVAGTLGSSFQEPTCPEVRNPEASSIYSDNKAENKEEQKPSKAGTHKEFIQAWTTAFKAHWGWDYKFSGAKDGSAVKSLLAVLSPEEALRVSREAWGNGGFWCKQAATLAGLSSKLNEIRAELAAPVNASGKPVENNPFRNMKGN